jgi:hypothetical protein
MKDEERQKLVEIISEELSFDYVPYLSEKDILSQILKIKYCESCGKSLNLDDTCISCLRDTKISTIISD